MANIFFFLASCLLQQNFSNDLLMLLIQVWKRSSYDVGLNSFPPSQIKKSQKKNVNDFYRRKRLLINFIYLFFSNKIFVGEYI